MSARPGVNAAPTECELTFLLPVLLLSLAANQVNGGQRVATVLMYLSDVEEGELEFAPSVCCPVLLLWVLLHGALVPCAAAFPPASCMQGAC